MEKLTTARGVWLGGMASGLLAGCAMALSLCTFAAATGIGFLTPLQLMAATFFGTQTQPGGAISTAVGLLLHLLIAVVIGVAFASLVRYSTTVMAMIFGIAASVLIWAITTFVAVPLLDPALWRVLPRVRTGWFVSHLLFGICLMVTPSLVTRLSSRTHPDGVRNEDLRAA